MGGWLGGRESDSWVGSSASEGPRPTPSFVRRGTRGADDRLVPRLLEGEGTGVIDVSLGRKDNLRKRREVS